MTTSRVGYKPTTEDEQIQGTFNIIGEANNAQLNIDQLRLNDLYSLQIWSAVVDWDCGGASVAGVGFSSDFLHPHGPFEVSIGQLYVTSDGFL